MISKTIVSNKLVFIYSLEKALVAGLDSPKSSDT